MVQCFCASDGPVSSIRLGKLPATRPPMVGKTVNGWFKRNVQLWYQSNLVQDRIIFRHVSPPINVKLVKTFCAWGWVQSFTPKLSKSDGEPKFPGFPHHHPAATGSGLLPAGGACPFTAALPGNKGTPLAFHVPRQK